LALSSAFQETGSRTRTADFVGEEKLTNGNDFGNTTTVKITSGGIFRVASIVKRLWKSHANSGICFPTCSHSISRPRIFTAHECEVHFHDYPSSSGRTGRSQIFAMTECDRGAGPEAFGGATLHSIGDISRHQRLEDNDYEAMAPQYMLAELCEDNRQLTQSLRSSHDSVTQAQRCCQPQV